MDAERLSTAAIRYRAALLTLNAARDEEVRAQRELNEARRAASKAFGEYEAAKHELQEVAGK